MHLPGGRRFKHMRCSLPWRPGQGAPVLSPRPMTAREGTVSASSRAVLFWILRISAAGPAIQPADCDKQSARIPVQQPIRRQRPRSRRPAPWTARAGCATQWGKPALAVQGVPAAVSGTRAFEEAELLCLFFSANADAILWPRLAPRDISSDWCTALPDRIADRRWARTDRGECARLTHRPFSP